MGSRFSKTSSNRTVRDLVAVGHRQGAMDGEFGRNVGAPLARRRPKPRWPPAATPQFRLPWEPQATAYSGRPLAQIPCVWGLRMFPDAAADSRRPTTACSTARSISPSGPLPTSRVHRGPKRGGRARMGLREEEATAWGHKSYDPGAERLPLRVTGERTTCRLLGAQMVGPLARRRRQTHRRDGHCHLLWTPVARR